MRTYAHDWVKVSSPMSDTENITTQDGWLTTEIVILNRLGLHARPAMSFVDTSNAFQSDIRVCKGPQEVDGKSIMSMMMLAATQGTKLLVKAKGDDAQDAIDKLLDLVERKFDEE